MSGWQQFSTWFQAHPFWGAFIVILLSQLLIRIFFAIVRASIRDMLHDEYGILSKREQAKVDQKRKQEAEEKKYWDEFYRRKRVS